MNSKEEFIYEESGQIKTSRYKSITIALIIANIVAFIGTIFVNAASTIPIKGIFDVATGSVSNKYELEITPAGWTFSTWGAIYIWQACWLIFNLILIFVRNRDGSRFVCSPPILTPTFHLFVLSNFGFNIAWLFIWATEKFTVSFIFLIFLVASLYFAIYISHRNVYLYKKDLERHHKTVLWLFRILVNNGLAFYATWVTIATNLNMAIAFTYEWQDENQPDKSTSSLVALSILALIILIYFIFDVIVFEKYFRYTYSPYLQMGIAFGGVLSKNWDTTKATCLFSLVLAIIGPCLMPIIKIILLIKRSCTRN